jgi:hypothetical protein
MFNIAIARQCFLSQEIYIYILLRNISCFQEYQMYDVVALTSNKEEDKYK